MTSRYELLKLSKDGKLMKKVEQDSLESVTINDNKVYMCGRSHIEVYDLDLNFIQYINSPECEIEGFDEPGGFDEPNDVKFDADGNMYIAETASERVQEMATLYECSVKKPYMNQLLFTLLANMCMCVIGVVVVLWCMRPLVSLSPHLGSGVAVKESSAFHALSPLVPAVLCMYVIVQTTEFRYSELKYIHESSSCAYAVVISVCEHSEDCKDVPIINSTSYMHRSKMCARIKHICKTYVYLELSIMLSIINIFILI